MKPSYVFLFAFLFSGCDNTPDIDYGPCKFAPPESKFEIFSSTWSNCEDCFLNLLFMGKEYSFAGNQLKTTSYGWNKDGSSNLMQEINNAFLSFHLISPATVELLNNNRGVKIPLSKADSLSAYAFSILKHNTPPPFSASFGVYNYCQNFFEPVNDVNLSHHQITDAELVESYTSLIGATEADLHPHQTSIFNCSGELQATFIINGETQVVTVRYKVRAKIQERL